MEKKERNERKMVRKERNERTIDGIKGNQTENNLQLKIKWEKETKIKINKQNNLAKQSARCELKK